MMIRKIIVYTMILLIVYNLYLLGFKTFGTQPQSSFDINITKAQDYLDEKPIYDYVTVGSSMGNRINTDIFPKEFYFLTFSGLSSFDGLEIIKQRKNLPKIIFIETNIMNRQLNVEFISDALNPGVLYLKKYMPSVLKKNKPSSLLHKPMAYLLYGTRNQFEKPNQIEPISKESNSVLNNLDKKNGIYNRIEDSTINVSPKTRNSVHTAHFEYIKKNMDNGVAKEFLNDRMNDLKSYVSYFESLGVTIVFYEMPIDQRLQKTKRVVDIKRVFENEFPSKQYNYIIAPDDFKVISNDGIHLTGSSIEQYSTFFKFQSQNF